MSAATITDFPIHVDHITLHNVQYAGLKWIITIFRSSKVMITYFTS